MTDLEAYDALPPRLREALRAHPVNHCAKWALVQLADGNSEDSLIYQLKSLALKFEARAA